MTTADATGNNGSQKGEMIFMMGLPAAGKSTYAEAHFACSHNFIDPDAIKLQHPEYDPANAFLVHDWSTAIADQMLEAALLGGGKWLVDGTGTNAEKMVQRIEEAKAEGFFTRLVYVKCTLATSIERAGCRERRVPVQVIVEKASTIATAFKIVSQYADSVEVIEND